MFKDIASEFPLSTPRPKGVPTPLEGMKIIDFSHFIAGPFATMILADMGADVIKVEAPGRGDEFRYYPPAHPASKTQGAPFVWSNRNKRSVAIDLKNPAGLAVVRELISTADIVVENFSTGVMKRFGLDYEACRLLNPTLIYCSVSAYGREGAFADRLGFDPVAQAESGFISMNGYPDRQGVRALSPVMDISTAMMACNAILGALVSRSTTGKGQCVEVALYDNALLMTGYATMQYMYSGVEPQRNGNTSPDTCPSGVFQAQDKPFYINCGNDAIFHRLAEQVLERADLACDPILADRNGRIEKREELFRILDEEFARHPWSYWQPRMRAASIPYGEVRTVGGALSSPETKARNLITKIDDPQLGWMPNVALPIRYSGTPLADPAPAPTVGQHTKSVLRDSLGYSDEKIEELVNIGALYVSVAPLEI
jgi:crotonobetainyl-CoA:carnitine CoA-transferase CaiB-like acyl-CoA transferase